MKPGNRHGNVKWCQITQSASALADERKCSDRKTESVARPVCLYADGSF